MKNTLEFDPEVLRRFVNFMNNPDERTAIDQYGNGDKYFGVCTLMVTMPGLPMLGHGQIEGFAEKYGMEFRRPLWDETPDRALLERHEREIFPLMRQRPLFAGVEQFLLYDFFRTDGTVDEDVFAYSNGQGDERALVVYNNRFGDTRGWVKTSVAFAQKTGHGDDKALVQRTLAEGLGLEAGDDWYSIARDQVSGLEYIRSNRVLREEGLHVELGAYRRMVLIGFRQVQDNQFGQYGQLMAYLEGRGVPSVEEALREIRLQPIQRPFSALVDPELLRRLLVAETSGPGPGVDLDATLFADVEGRLRDFLIESRHLDAADGDLESVVRSASAHLGGVLGLLAQATDPGATVAELEEIDLEDTTEAEAETLAEEEADEAPAAAESPTRTTNSHSNGVSDYAATALDDEIEEDDAPSAGQTAAELFRDRPEAQAALLIWALTRPLGELLDPRQPAEHSRALFDEWMLAGPVERALQGLGLDDGAAMVGVGLVRVLLAHERALADTGDRGPRAVMERLLEDADVRNFLGVNRHRDVLWFSQERYDELVAGLLATAVVSLTVEAVAGAEDVETAMASAPDLDGAHALARAFWDAEEPSGYQLERLVRLLSA